MCFALFWERKFTNFIVRDLDCNQKCGYSWKVQNCMEISSGNSNGKSISVWFLVVPIKLDYSWKVRNCMENSIGSSIEKWISVWKSVIFRMEI